MRSTDSLNLAYRDDLEPPSALSLNDDGAAANLSTTVQESQQLARQTKEAAAGQAVEAQAKAGEPQAKVALQVKTRGVVTVGRRPSQVSSSRRSGCAPVRVESCVDWRVLLTTIEACGRV